MAYGHGVTVLENPTSLTPPVEVDSAVQFIVGTAPVNLLDDPAAAVNKPILVYSFAEAVTKVGYSDNFEKFTACESIDASFNVYNVSPLIIVNVLDPAEHNIAVPGEVHAITNGKVTIEEEGILLDVTFVVKSEDGMTTYTKDTDYKVDFDGDGYPLLEVIGGGQIETDAETSLTFDYTQLDPFAVTEDDIIGGYDVASGKYKGLDNIKQVFPQFGLIPGLTLCPGWSHYPAVGIAMSAKMEEINSLFKCNAVKDIDTTAATGAVVYSDVKQWKDNNSYTGKHDFVLWPMVKVGNKKYHYSSVFAPLIAYTDGQNDGVPYVSPSNKKLNISGTILADGTEVSLGLDQANLLNGNGIITAINFNGWKAWGNRTGVYPSSTDPKDAFIPVRRMFNWWGNTFILTYFQKVDDPMNRRLIENVVDSENIRANGFKAREQIAGARIEYLPSNNPLTDLIDGKIRFNQHLTPFPPAREITNELEFDPYALQEVLGGE